MTNIQRSRKKKGGIFKFFILLFVVVFAILNYFNWRPLHSVTLVVSGPILKVKETILYPLNSFFSYFSSKKELENKNKELEKNISSLKIEVLSNVILKNEYKGLLNQINSGEGSVDVAKVILKPPFSSFDNLIISGDFDESEINKKVYYRNIIIGEIVEVSDKTAVVKMYSASGYKTPAKLLGGSQFEVIGRGSGQYEVLLPKDIDVLEGDPIIYPDNEVVIFGVVNKVFSTEDDLFNKVLFNVPVDFSEINYVRIGSALSILE